MGKKAKRVYDENGNVTHKVCSKCGELKSIDEFSADKSKSDGHRSKCKECNKKYDKKHYKENKEQIKGYSKKYYEENKERRKEYDKKYRKEYKEREKYNVTHKVCSKCGELKSIGEFHADKGTPDGHASKCKGCRKKYMEENKERKKEYDKKYYKENKEQRKEYSKKYMEENKERKKQYREKWYKELCDEAIIRIKTIVEQDPTRYDYKVGGEIYGVIYLVCCKPANKYYVGQTTNGFENRYPRGFFNDNGHRTKDDLKEDYKKYGEDSFEITEIFKVAHNKEELDDLEVYYIDHFNSYYDGYNKTRGNHHVK